jgi:hypothetical protein
MYLLHSLSIDQWIKKLYIWLYAHIYTHIFIYTHYVVLFSCKKINGTVDYFTLSEISQTQKDKSHMRERGSERVTEGVKMTKMYHMHTWGYYNEPLTLYN